MAGNRTNHTGRKKRGGYRFIQIKHKMLESDAWRGLSSKAGMVYIELLRRYNGNNNGQISLSASEAGIACRGTKDTGNRALHELKACGFIAVYEDSRFTQKHKRARKWRLTHEACEGYSPTNDWMHYREGETQSDRKDRQSDKKDD